MAATMRCKVRAGAHRWGWFCQIYVGPLRFNARTAAAPCKLAGVLLVSQSPPAKDIALPTADGILWTACVLQIAACNFLTHRGEWQAVVYSVWPIAKTSSASRTRLLAVNNRWIAARWIFIFVPPTPIAP